MVLFVSHNMASIRQLCNRGVLLDQGRVSYVGNIKDTIEQYLGLNFNLDEISLSNRTDRLGDERIKLRAVYFKNTVGERINEVFSGDYLKIEFHLDFERDLDLRSSRVGCAFEDMFRNYATQWASDEMNQDFSTMKNGVFFLEIPALTLRPNTYYLYVQISLGSTDQKDFCDVIHGAASIRVLSAPFFAQDMLLKPNRGHMAVIDARFTF